MIVRALLILWHLDPSGAGTATTELFDSLDAACADTRGGACYGYDVEHGGNPDVVYALAYNRCTINRTDEIVATWTCKGHK